jgi:hypothetical protein
MQKKKILDLALCGLFFCAECMEETLLNINSNSKLLIGYTSIKMIKMVHGLNNQENIHKR